MATRPTRVYLRRKPDRRQGTGRRGTDLAASGECDAQGVSGLDLLSEVGRPVTAVDDASVDSDAPRPELEESGSSE